MNKDIASIRRDYQLASLDEASSAVHPMDQFGNWWEEAIQSNIDEVNAFTLSTIALNGSPAARIVLLKGFTPDGFVFFTNYESYKGRQMAENPKACLVFFWKELERQVRVTGLIEKINARQSDEYFHSRPEASRIGAWASPQSQVIDGRTVLVTNAAKYAAQFMLLPPRPPHWGGFRLVPDRWEFWQGRPSRLHDRFRYVLQPDASWSIERLAP